MLRRGRRYRALCECRQWQEGLIDCFERMAAEHPGKRIDEKRAFAEGNPVILHCHHVSPGGLEYAKIDVLRLDDAMRAVTFAMALKTDRGDQAFALQHPRPGVRIFCLAAIAAAQIHPLTKAAMFSIGIDGFARAALLRTYGKEPRLLAAVDQIARRNQRKAQPLEAESRI